MDGDLVFYGGWNRLDKDSNNIVIDISPLEKGAAIAPLSTKSGIWSQACPSCDQEYYQSLIHDGYRDTKRWLIARKTLNQLPNQFFM